MNGQGSAAAVAVAKTQTQINLEAAQESLKKAQAEHLATLPVCPADKLGVLVDVTRKVNVSEAEAKEVKEIKAGFRFTEEHRDQLAAAKASHRMAINTPEVREQLRADIEKGYLKTAQRKLRADGRTVVTVKAVV